MQTIKKVCHLDVSGIKLTSKSVMFTVMTICVLWSIYHVVGEPMTRSWHTQILHKNTIYIIDLRDNIRLNNDEQKNLNQVQGQVHVLKHRLLSSDNLKHFISKLTHLWVWSFSFKGQGHIYRRMLMPMYSIIYDFINHRPRIKRM